MAHAGAQKVLISRKFQENSKAPLGKTNPPASCRVNVIESALHHSGGQPGRAATPLSQLWDSSGALGCLESIFLFHVSLVPSPQPSLARVIVIILPFGR